MDVERPGHAPDHAPAPDSTAQPSSLFAASLLDYLATLHRGLVIVLTTVIASILLAFGGGVAGAIVTGGGDPLPPSFMLISAILGALLSFATLYGWWLLAAPDPSQPADSHSDRWRRTVRVVIPITVVFALVGVASALVELNSPAPSSTFTFSPLEIVNLIGSFGFGVIVWIAQMLYIRDLAPRIPSEKIYRRAKLLVWLGPVLNTVGLLILIGPLIALVLYWNMRDEFRKEIKAIRVQQAGMQ